MAAEKPGPTKSADGAAARRGPSFHEGSARLRHRAGPGRAGSDNSALAATEEGAAHREIGDESHRQRCSGRKQLPTASASSRGDEQAKGENRQPC